MRTALVGAGQTCWQIRQPLQMSGFTMGSPASHCMAPGMGHCSMQTEHREVRARQWRPDTRATRRGSGSATGLGAGRARRPKIRKRSRRETSPMTGAYSRIERAASPLPIVCAKPDNSVPVTDPGSQDQYRCLNSHAYPVSVARLSDLVILGMSDDSVSSFGTVPDERVPRGGWCAAAGSTSACRDRGG